MTRKFLSILAMRTLPAVCAREPTLSDAEIVTTIANEFVIGNDTQSPDEVYEVGYPDAPLPMLGASAETWIERKLVED